MFKNKKIGTHEGLPLYTIGQRRGIKIGGIGPFYVLKADYKTNKLYVTNKANDPALFSTTMKVKRINWVSGKPPKLPFTCNVRIRYGHKAVPAVVKNGGGDMPGCVCAVQFKIPQRAITSGQAAVFYKGDEIIGGGEIL